MTVRLRARELYRYGLFAFLLAILVIFLLWPIFMTIKGGFLDPQGRFTLRYCLGVFQDPLWMAGLGNSLLIAICTTVLCLLIGLPLAVLSARFDFRGKAFLSSLVLVPLILPPFVGAIGLRALLGRYGAFNSLLAQVGLIDPSLPGIDFLGGGFVGGRLAGVVVMEALHLYPILYLNVAAALANLDPALDEAAQNLGAGRWRRFFRITLPLILPGVFAGGTIVFIWSFTELGTPLMFDYYRVTPVQIFWGIQEIQTNPRSFALVVVMLTVAVVLYLLGKWALGGRGYAMASKASIASQPQRLGGASGLAAGGLFLLVTALAILPHLGVVIMSLAKEGSWYRSILPAVFTLEHYRNALSHELVTGTAQHWGAIQNSLLYASLAMVLSVVIGLCISYLTVRAKLRGGWLLDSLAMLPLAVPGLVMAFGYVAITLGWPFNGELLSPHLLSWFAAVLPWDWWHGIVSWCNHAPLSAFQIVGPAPNPIPLLVITYGVRRLPYVVRSASAGLEQTSGEMEEAALNLGASPLTAIRKIIVPLIMANLIAGGILAFSFSMLEVSDSLILAQKQEHFPITKAIWELFNRLGDGPYIASAMGVWGMVLLAVTLIGAGLLMGKKMGAIFRV